MSATEKFRKVVWYALSSPDLSSEVKQALAELFSPQNLAIAAGVLGVWGASHFFGVGEVVDVVLVGAAYATLGVQAVQGLVELSEFGVAVVKAKSEADLRRAASSLTRAFARLGADVALALLTRNARIELRSRKLAPASKGQAPTSSAPPRSSSGGSSQTVSTTPLRNRLAPVPRALVQKTEQELQKIVQQAVQLVDSGLANGRWAKRLSQLPKSDKKYAMWRGNAIDQEARALIEQAKLMPNSPLPTTLKTNVTGPFKPKRPDIQLPLGNGRYAVWDITSQRQLGHAVKYANQAAKTPSMSLDYLAEITY